MSKEEIEFSVLKVHRLPETDGNRTKAFVDLGINDALLIKGVKVIDGRNGLFVAMPSELDRKNERWFERVRCMSKDVKEKITQKVLEAYQTT